MDVIQRGLKESVQRHKTRKWWSWDLDLALSDSKAYTLSTGLKESQKQIKSHVCSQERSKQLTEPECNLPLNPRHWQLLGCNWKSGVLKAAQVVLMSSRCRDSLFFHLLQGGAQVVLGGRKGGSEAPRPPSSSLNLSIPTFILSPYWASPSDCHWKKCPAEHQISKFKPLS